jgi:hypothetical protein
LPRTPAGEIEWPSFLISMATRIWPRAGCSSENSTIRAAISGAVRFARIGFLRLISCNASALCDANREIPLQFTKMDEAKKFFDQEAARSGM